MTDYKIVRSRRRTAVIEITEDLRVIVRVPYTMPDERVRRMVREKQSIIDMKLARMRERLDKQYAAFGEEVPITQSEIRELAAQARREIPPRVEHFAGIMGIHYGRITIRNQATLWGSCSAKGNLNFNCLLMLCPAEVRDYVIVHELCHRKEMNHSPRFWAEVGGVLPDYRLQRSWLKEYGGRLIRRMREGQET